jgi:hypothetical protein
VGEKPINERIAILETDMEAVKLGVSETKDDIKDINRTTRAVLFSSVGALVLLVLDIAMRMKQ